MGLRPVDRYGLALSTSHEAAEAYRRGVQGVLLVQADAYRAIREAVALDPGFALGHAALALLGAEGGAPVEAAMHLKAAIAAVRQRGDDRERGFVAAVAQRLGGRDEAAAESLLRHVRAYPTDALAVNIAVPTIAFGGVTSDQETWHLVEWLHDYYGDDWWYLGQLAFVRQDQERWEEAESLAERALAVQPASGHAVHARTHVFYETGDHHAGLAWLDDWIRDHGPAVSHGAHFSWHAALHEIALGDDDAVRRRYREQLAPPLVTGARALVDSASLLWRCRVTRVWDPPLPIGPVLDVVPCDWLTAPPSAFIALHSVLALAGAEDPAGLHRLRRYAMSRPEPEFADVIAPLCEGFAACVEGRLGLAVVVLRELLPRLRSVGGSAAQRDVVEETLVSVLIAAGRHDEAAELVSTRLDRREFQLRTNDVASR